MPANHEEPYKKYEGNDGKLLFDCGHHCGVIQVGGTDTHVGHCYCGECHGPKKVVGQFDPDISAILSDQSGINPGDIR